jgi:hypothetical protein
MRHVFFFGVILAAGFTGAAPASAGTKIYSWGDGFFEDNKPGVRWCLNNNYGCGKVAADEFCQSRNFVGAIGFAKDTAAYALNDRRHLVGIPGTQSALLVGGTKCTDQSCRTFASITCTDGRVHAVSHHKKKQHKRKH